MYEINWEPSIAEQPTELSKDPAVGFTFYEGLFDTSVQTIEGVYEQVTKVGPVEPRQIDFMVQLGTRLVAWLEKDIEEWMNSKIEGSEWTHEREFAR